MIKHKVLLSIVIIIVVVLTTINLIISNKKEQKELCFQLSKLTNEVVESSYKNYGNIAYTSYNSTISSKDFESMYYIGVIDNNLENRQSFDIKYLDRHQYDILISYHSWPETTLITSNEATTTYVCISKYSVNPVVDNVNTGYSYYNDYKEKTCFCTVHWQLQDKQWSITKFTEELQEGSPKFKLQKQDDGRLHVVDYESLGDDNRSEHLNKTVYNIVEESYKNYGNIELSDYQNVISAHNYNLLYYLRSIDYDDPEKEYIDRSKYDVLTSYHSWPETVFDSDTQATTTYFYECKYSTPEHQKLHSDYTFIRSFCTIKWQLKDNGQWYIVDFIDPP